ncbi:alpha/beta hydrolase [Capnocytophaga sp.]|uniref:alpha/beta hydrolase n=1 Tax=Capnocytophaga sp. TaxID=44737 RepID=UPI0026DADA0C|nr:alpha/beta fold hydrolase [Capnocytophaga sp.]MDO5105633.1 alpha/beta fold hydrolase [Capnocytophaga sp.]
MKTNNAPHELPLHCIIREPLVKTKRPPVIFMLHGYGSNEEDLFSFANELPAKYAVVSVQAPHKLADFGYAWYSIDFQSEQGKWSDDAQAVESRDLIVEFIDATCELYGYDTKNITLIGFSQGSILSMAVALSYPDKIRNVIALSGYLNTNILKEDYRERTHFTPKFYISHGLSDQVIPVEWARQTVNILKELNVDYTYEEFPVGHGVSPQNFYSFREWLPQQ